MAYIATKCLLGHLLKNSGLTQAELSRRTGIHKSQISAYVNMRYGKTMEIAHARSISMVLELPTPYCLYEWTEEHPSGRTDD
ncbi:helix-turn-helix domain-containing protein [Paenibacillus polymyxa]|uniref:helix-turn-helix domain-containing protein n=1 Tax=Paenibacillus TaxID=44249 RepID=UPI00142DD74F|nr:MULTISPECIES: helix-turn-helix transcriptional regulator [Paenibacillus]KAF6658914.1 helix-turn-helix transcriptional regulator [Paenibacillus sp. EKM301P]UBS85449.1 helix-turn-helix transcriptional regulator [Paenibacillus polymyxa]WHX33967.1 helix-turn-helix transcriptional regulator [Paenibacillus polymyxa]